MAFCDYLRPFVGAVCASDVRGIDISRFLFLAVSDLAHAPRVIEKRAEERGARTSVGENSHYTEHTPSSSSDLGLARALLHGAEQAHANMDHVWLSVWPCSPHFSASASAAGAELSSAGLSSAGELSILLYHGTLGAAGRPALSSSL